MLTTRVLCLNKQSWFRVKGESSNEVNKSVEKNQVQYHVIPCKFEVGFYNQYMHLEGGSEERQTPQEKKQSCAIFARILKLLSLE